MKKFLIGFIVGMTVLAGAYFYLRRDIRLHADVGSFLDQDAFFLADGNVIYGRLLRELDKTVLVETKDGTFTLDRSTVKEIDKNIFLRYLRQLM